MQQFDGTTILAVRRDGKVCIGGDGQVSMGNTMVKGNARKVRRLYGDKVIAGFAGGTADAFTLFERFEGKLEKHSGHLTRAAVEMAKDWRTDRYLRKLEALLLVADAETTLMITGNGDVMEPEAHGVMAIGSGGPFAAAAARALAENTDLDARTVVERALHIAAEICIYTNHNLTIETIGFAAGAEPAPAAKPLQRAQRMNDGDVSMDGNTPLNPPLNPGAPETATTAMTPREIVAELDRHIVGQTAAKKAVAIALRNRWRRQQTPEAIRGEITPKNILMIGPTGVGKTEIARRLAKLANAPFVKVEATKFTEVGYVGRDVDSIIRELADVSIKLTRDQAVARVRAKAEAAAEERVLDALLPRPTDFGEASQQRETENGAARQVFRKRLREGKLDDTEIELKLNSTPANMQIMGPPGMEEMTSQLQGMFKSMGQGQQKTRKLKIKDALKLLIDEEGEKLVDEEAIRTEALKNAEDNGIVFIDELDKVCKRTEYSGADVSREGVQRDLLPLVEGCTVSTKHGSIKTDHILFIASGAFHMSKPSDLIPELQGRLPIRVELDALKTEDFVRILSEPTHSLTEQYKALLLTEGVTVEFGADGLQRLAEVAWQVNERTENIGARRLHTVMERLMEEVAFTASDQAGTSLSVDAAYVNERLGKLAGDEDLSRYIL